MSSTPAEQGGGWKLEMPTQISEGAPQCAIVGKRDTNCECEFWPNLPDPRGSQGQGCLVRGGLHNFPVDLSLSRGGSPLPGSVSGVCGARFRRFCVFPAPVCHGAGTLYCSRRKRFQNQSLLGSWAKHTCFARKNLSGATLWGVAPHPFKHQVGEGEREREGVRVVSR